MEAVENRSCCAISTCEFAAAAPSAASQQQLPAPTLLTEAESVPGFTLFQETMGFRECWSHSQSQVLKFNYTNPMKKKLFFASDWLRKKQFWPTGHEGRPEGKGFLAL